MSTASIAQTNESVFLKWKIRQQETLTYKTVMQEIDTANFKEVSLNLGGLAKLFEDTTSAHKNAVKRLFSEVNKSLEKNDLITDLSINAKGNIDVTMTLRKKDIDSSKRDTTSRKDAELEGFMRALSTNVMLRGAITTSGQIESFYVKNDQKNLIAMLFELPNKEVKIGDKWSITANLISMDQNFKCDSSYKKNIVTLIDLKKSGSDQIAIIKYDVVEFVVGDFINPMVKKNVKTTMKITYNGVSEFSITEGRWSKYEGIMSITSSGVMTSNSTKKVTLIKVD